jgi:hypothetical protein
VSKDKLIFKPLEFDAFKNELFGNDEARNPENPQHVEVQSPTAERLNSE